ncbi:GSCOCG00012196001-RA-CDS [Cotesia congregata]|nr:GSCOCG00012196001-RA-CDS [Cotesia congregata]
MQEAINDLLLMGAIQECVKEEGQFLSSIFLVPKKNGKMRFILNLKNLNSFIETTHFKMEDFRTVLELKMSKYCFMASFDLQDAYFMIPIHKNFWKFLRFFWNGRLYEFICMPFGLSSAPWIFTKISKPIVSFLRSLGYLSVVYLDDWWLVNDSIALCSQNVKILREFLESLGFIINEKKSKLIPSTSCKFLGFIFDSEQMTVELTEEKRFKIHELILKFKNLNHCSIREFSQLVGNITAACPAINYGWLHSKKFEQQHYLELLKVNEDYDSIMKISTSLTSEFDWWLNNVLISKNPMRNSKFLITIYSDASTTGWGALSENQVVYGHWNHKEKSFHIDYLELLAAFNGLKTFASGLSDCEILLQIDNSTTIAYINKMGGTKHKYLNDLTYDIWRWCESKNLWIFASYIPSKDNVQADAASRVDNIDTEWELSSSAYQRIVSQFNEPDIDLFASNLNNKCKKYCSWHRDPLDFCIDAFTIDWNELNFFAFPPFSLILKTLKKIQTDQACGISVVPNWCGQPWYPLWLSLLDSQPIIFQPDFNLLRSPCRKIQHPLAQKMSLMAARLSARPSSSEV